MVPRPEIEALPVKATLEEARAPSSRRVTRACGYAGAGRHRGPLVQEDGHGADTPDGSTWRQAGTAAVFIPVRPAGQLAEEMQSSRGISSRMTSTAGLKVSCARRPAERS